LCGEFATFQEVLVGFLPLASSVNFRASCKIRHGKPYPQITQIAQMLEASFTGNSAQLRNESLNNQCNLRSKPATSCFFSKKLSSQESQFWLSELDRSSHHLLPFLSDAVVISFENFVDQFVSAQ
jgi:hypothetical protein